MSSMPTRKRVWARSSTTNTGSSGCGTARVYEAVHRNGHRVAVKVLHPHLAANSGLCTRFLREGYVANKVEHLGAVRILDDDIAQDRSVFLVMELLEGETLEARWLRGGQRLPAEEVCQLGYQLLDVLAASHAKGVVHRDIKPDNLFLTHDGVLKVLDFGIARLLEPGGREGMTLTGCMIGTPAFMPPEQALGRSRDIDGQTDLWAAGATMFTLLSGSFVHEAETVEELLIRAGTQAARPVRTIVPDISPHIAAVVDQALAFEKPDRWNDARSMQAAIADAYAAAFGSNAPELDAHGSVAFAGVASMPPASSATSDKPSPRSSSSWPLARRPGGGSIAAAVSHAGRRRSSRPPRGRKRRAPWGTLLALGIGAIAAGAFAARGSTFASGTAATATATQLSPVMPRSPPPLAPALAPPPAPPPRVPAPALASASAPAHAHASAPRSPAVAPAPTAPPVASERFHVPAPAVSPAPAAPSDLPGSPYDIPAPSAPSDLANPYDPPESTSPPKAE
jgi:serine/threonine protein kinase